MSIIEEKRQKLEESLFHELEYRKVKSLPENLVKVTASILSKMFAENSSYELLEIIGFGSIWAWALDDYWDNTRISLASKKQELDKYIKFIESLNFDYMIEDKNLPIFAILLVDCINKIINYSKLNKLDKKALKEILILTLKGVEYELLHINKNISIEELLNNRSYSYITPFYGVVIDVCDYHIANDKEYKFLFKMLLIFGRVMRLYNDLATFEKEKEGDEVNLVLIFLKQGKTKDEAIEIVNSLIKSSLEDYYITANKFLNKSFINVLTHFLEVHNKAYLISNIRIINPDIL